MKSVNSMQERNKLLHEFLNIGEMMLASGAEIKRVEDTLIRLGTAYGAIKMNVFVITSSIVVTMAFENGEELTQTRRIMYELGTDFTRLEALNELSRLCCANPLTVEELKQQITLIDQKASKKQLYLGSVIGGGCFAIFFGGTLLDGAVAAIFALFICVLKNKLKPICPNNVIFNLLCSFLTGIGICVTARIFPLLHSDMIMIGDIMLLIPGLVMTNSIRDIFVGDTISGVMRLVESCLWAGAIASGFMIAIQLIGV